MSLNLRIILSATLVLVIFITLTAAALNRAFYDSTESALRDKLTSQLYALMAAAEIDEKRVSMPSDELDALLGLPSSGVYAFITDQNTLTLWQSSSVLSATPPDPVSLKGGEKRFNKLSIGEAEYYNLAYGINWESDNTRLALTFNITSDLDSFNKQIQQYRKTLWGWLLAMAFLLLISQGIILRWGLSPLRKVDNELSRIESGEQQRIEDHYPVEIDRLTHNINQLLEQERTQKTRYRNALGDLAHSLKTPLAVMQTSLETPSKESSDDSGVMQEQIVRMNSIVEYQLQRAATAGSASIGKSVDVEITLQRMLDSLQKVYQDKNISISLNIPHKLTFRGDEGDLMELLGNLLDNAFKWSRQRIEVMAEKQGNKLSISVMDDGPGIPQEQAELLLQRGVRADQSVAGHGIGLNIVCNIIDAYHGELHIMKSALGGAEIHLLL